jgi:hypothetical protein
MTGDTVEQLRRDIDSGRSGTKIDYPDPAAAPLGTDEEAAGTPLSPAVVRQARLQEVDSSRVQTREHGFDRGAFIYAGIIAILGAALSGVAIWMSL